MDIAQTAWLAGLYEGEGSLGFTGKHSVMLVVTMADRDVVERCRDLTGVGRVNGPYVHSERRRPMWTWSVGRQDHVAPILRAILPWVGERRAQRIRDGLARMEGLRRRGFCKRGHPMHGENLYRAPGNGQGYCRACMRMREYGRKKVKT